MFSFSSTKTITTLGSGGAAVFKDIEVANIARELIDYDNPGSLDLRFNLKMTDPAAAYGNVQLGRLNEFLEKRQAIFDVYSESGLPLIPYESNENSYAAKYRAVIFTESASRVISKLREHNVIAIYPITKDEFVDSPFSYPNACRYAESHVSLPIYPSLGLKTARNVAKIVGDHL